MTASLRSVSDTPRPEWRETAWRQELNKGMILSGGNGTVAFGEVLAGTLMALVSSSSSEIRPLGIQPVSSAVSAAAAVPVADASNFYAGDEVTSLIVENSYDSVTTDADGAGKTLVTTAVAPGDTGITLELLDPSANSSPLAVTYDAGALVVSLETDGGGSIVSTLEEVRDALNATNVVTCAYGTAAGTETAVAVAAAALTGGYLTGDVLTETLTVLSVNKTATPNVVTMTGATTIPATGGIVTKDCEALFVGILEDQPNTTDPLGVETTGLDQVVTVGVGGLFRASEITGYDELLLPYLTGSHVGEEGALGAMQFTNGIVGFHPTIGG